MDVLDILKNEDDNPRGREGTRFLGGNTLEEAAAAEERRVQIKAQRWPIGKQEHGILHLITSKTLFQRLQLPEPRWVDGVGRWTCSDKAIHAAYSEAKKCCHPEWSYHPKRERGFELLSEAFDTLTNANGKRDMYVAEVAETIHAREEVLEAAAAAAARGAAVARSMAASAGKKRCIRDQHCLSLSLSLRRGLTSLLSPYAHARVSLYYTVITYITTHFQKSLDKLQRAFARAPPPVGTRARCMCARPPCHRYALLCIV